MLLRLQDLLTAHRLGGLKCGDLHGQVGPQEDLSGVEHLGLEIPQAHPALQLAPLREAGGLQLGGKGQGCLHAAQALPLLGLVEHHGPHAARHLGQALPGLPAVQGRLALDPHDPGDVGAGVGDDGLQRLLLANCPAGDDLISLHDFPVKFQFHFCRPLPFPTVLVPSSGPRFCHTI